MIFVRSRSVHSVDLGLRYKRYKSDAWKYFSTINKMNVHCKICKIKPVYHRTTSSMTSHLCIKHKEKRTGSLSSPHWLVVLACTAVMSPGQRD